MKVAIVGSGIEGRAACHYWQTRGDQVTMLDADVEAVVPIGVSSVLGPQYLDRLDSYDLIVRSPGVRPWLVRTKTPVTTGVQEFFNQCNARIIGVTGTKGKGTTSALIAKILEEAGKRVWLGGNIGNSPLEFLAKIKASDLVILELSSFQLMDLHTSPHIAVCLMIVPEHLDWHRNMREYVAAKGNIFWHQRPEDIAIYNGQNEFSTEIAQLSPGKQIAYMEKPGAMVKDGWIVIDDTRICRTDEVGLIGPHNLQNICAAITTTWDLTDRNTQAVRRAVQAFRGLEHRLEFVRELDGVRYLDDSFSTTPETAIAAIDSFVEPKVMILGGSNKQSSYTELAKAVIAGNVREVVLIGETAAELHSALSGVGYSRMVMGLKTMSGIVKQVQSLAQRGDVVLLSPACASFGLFKNYKDRGDQFKNTVRTLEGAQS